VQLLRFIGILVIAYKVMRILWRVGHKPVGLVPQSASRFKRVTRLTERAARFVAQAVSYVICALFIYLTAIYVVGGFLQAVEQ
jgi:hypothetical protein